MSIIVTAQFTPAAGRRDELIAALRVATAAVHLEDGCELYALHDGEDGSVWLIEKWTTEALLDAHGEGQAVRDLKGAIAGLVASSAVVTRMTAVSAGTDQQGLL